MVLKQNVLKTVKKPAPKGKQALGKKKKPKKDLFGMDFFSLNPTVIFKRVLKATW